VLGPEAVLELGELRVERLEERLGRLLPLDARRGARVDPVQVQLLARLDAVDVHRSLLGSGA